MANKRYTKDFTKSKEERALFEYAFEGERDVMQIRKLSAREYWLFMGFTKEQYALAEKAHVKANGDVEFAPLYKQAGNSIVVDCLTAIFQAALPPPNPDSPTLLIELFGGIGSPISALKRVGHKIDERSVYVEFDPKAVKSYNALYGTRHVPTDITKVDALPKGAHLLVHGSPCQDFSTMGNGAGGELGSGTRSSLLWNTCHLIEKLAPEDRPTDVLWENVKGVVNKTHKATYDAYCAKMEALGYRNFQQILNAKDYGVPQTRTRVFTLSSRRPDASFPVPPKRPLPDIEAYFVDDDVEDLYYHNGFMLPRALDGRIDYYEGE